MAIAAEPSSLDPARLSAGDVSYFYRNLMRGLYGYANDKGLVPEGAESCDFESKLKLVCRLRPVLWSDGSRVEAADYVRAFRRLAKAATATVDLLRNLKNALAVYAGTAAAEKLGVRAEGSQRLIFEFERADTDFLFKLSSSLLVPVKTENFPGLGEAKGLVFNGPYQVLSWTRGRRMNLVPNPRFQSGHPGRPPIEILFIEEDQTALDLYERKSLSFLRRLPTTSIPKYRSRPDFVQVPLMRFDYLGFGPELRDQPDLRAALSMAADFREMGKMLDALGIPGCPSLPEALLDKPHCVSFNLAKAKEHLRKVPPEARKKRLKLFFAKIGGDDLQKPMEWFQGQWKRNLDLRIDLEPLEPKVLLERLRSEPPALFRKGVPLERPTCLAALETFAPESSENFLRLKDPAFEKVLARLAEEASLARPSARAKKLCGEGVRFLLDRRLLIPLGRIHFTFLVDPRWQGWTLSEMNQLDLSMLRLKSP